MDGWVDWVMHGGMPQVQEPSGALSSARNVCGMDGSSRLVSSRLMQTRLPSSLFFSFFFFSLPFISYPFSNTCIIVLWNSALPCTNLVTAAE